MLNDVERQEIEAEVRHYEHKRAACVEALKIVQRHRGWVSDEHLRDIAALLEMTPDELDGVATFYNLIFRRAVGKHVLLLCDSVSCWIMGYERLRAHLTERLGISLGDTTADGRFTLLPVPCLGTCDHAPALMIGEALYRDLDVEKLDRILAQYMMSDDTPSLQSPLPPGEETGEGGRAPSNG
ncbi:MAG TPA: NADH-quinone oxidoreductase subunit NuoE [Alphaproteobacteria bacterium]|nr:NADH-quinone oxidoreductase subunit NuoE [Alphaproteobacteria bacterium]